MFLSRFLCFCSYKIKYLLLFFSLPNRLQHTNKKKKNHMCLSIYLYGNFNFATKMAAFWTEMLKMVLGEQNK